MSELNNNIKVGLKYIRIEDYIKNFRCPRAIRWRYAVDMTIEFRVMLDQEITEPQKN
jgi:hypothetical protein